MFKAVLFSELIDSFNLNRQHVQAPTHRLGHTLDLVLSRTPDEFIGDISTTHYLPSEHAAVTCLLNIGFDIVKMNIKTRKIRDIDMDVFRQVILDSELYTSPSTDVDQLVTQYEAVLSKLLEKHAPLISRSITCRPNAPWYNNGLRKDKQNLRRLERRWRSSKLEVDRQIYKTESHCYNQMILKAKKEYHTKQLENGNSCELFHKVDKMCKATSETMCK